VRLDEGFYQSLIDHPLPLREAAIRQISNRSMAIDLYIWWPTVFMSCGHLLRSDGPHCAGNSAKAMRNSGSSDEMQLGRYVWP